MLGPWVAGVAVFVVLSGRDLQMLLGLYDRLMVFGGGLVRVRRHVWAMWFPEIPFVGVDC
jgi:hypothetical protein